MSCGKGGLAGLGLGVRGDEKGYHQVWWGSWARAGVSLETPGTRVVLQVLGRREGFSRMTGAGAGGVWQLGLGCSWEGGGGAAQGVGTWGGTGKP